MDAVQSILNGVLFPEKFPPPNLALNTPAQHVHDAFWSDAHNRNLRLTNVEVEVRLGMSPRSGQGPFVADVPERMFRRMQSSLQSYGGWDAVSTHRDTVGYFPRIDESVRLIVRSDGSSVLQSKQKVNTADFACSGAPLDFRLAVNVELPMTTSARARAFTFENATRTVVRERSSYSLRHFRYDLTRVTHPNGRRENHVEIEIIDPPEIQTTSRNAQCITMELHDRIIDVLKVCEPGVTALNIALVRKRAW